MNKHYVMAVPMNYILLRLFEPARP